MRLAAPLSAAGEAKPLSEAGAAEFYCGVQTNEWQDAFGNHDSISRRQGPANLSTLEELSALAAETSSLGKPLFLTLNGSYTQEQLPHVIELASAFEDMGGVGVMVMDIALIILLKKRGSRLVRGLSLLAAVGSCSAVEFYRELGVTRIVFPRFLQPGQIAEITKRFPDMQAESIVWLDKCAFIDGYCRFIHSVGYRDCPETPGAPLQRIHACDMTYRLPACFELLGMPSPLPACAACSLKALAEAGVTVFKLGGRGRSLQTRLSGVRFLVMAGGLPDPGAIREQYARAFGSPCDPSLCYYPRAGC